MLPKFSLCFWLNSLCGSLQIAVLIGYQQVAVDMLTQRFNFNPQDALKDSMIPIKVLLVVSPILGKFVDWCGQRIMFGIVSNILLVSACIFNMIAPSCS